jgi:hypothetical protein
MQDPARLRRREPVREAEPDAQDVAPRQGERGLIEALAIDELVRDVRPPVDLADPIDRDDVGVLQPRDRAAAPPR